MITPFEIKAAIIALIKTKFKSVACYGADVKEGLKKPSFSIKLIPAGIENDNYSTFSCRYICAITYFQQKVSEIDSLKVTSDLHKVFGRKIHVADRYINITDFRYDFVGENSDILQIMVELSFLDAWDKEAEADPAKEVKINEKLED